MPNSGVTTSGVTVTISRNAYQFPEVCRYKTVMALCQTNSLAFNPRLTGVSAEYH